MKIILLISLLTTANAHATVGFSCDVMARITSARVCKKKACPIRFKVECIRNDNHCFFKEGEALRASVQAEKSVKWKKGDLVKLEYDNGCSEDGCGDGHWAYAGAGQCL